MRSDRAPDGLPWCGTCKGLRRVRVPLERPDGEGRVSRLEWCPDCGQEARRVYMRRAYQAKQARLAPYSQLIGRARRQTFDSFDLRQEEGRKTLPVRRAFDAARAFAEDPRGWLLLYGSRGTGKSHLAAAIANHLLNQASADDGMPPPAVLFLTTPALLDMLRSGYGEENADYDELKSLVEGADVLILDDLGVERLTPWAEEVLFQILDRRYQVEAPTVVVTNLDPRDLEPRIQDRLLDDKLAVVVEVIAPSYRQRKRSPGRVL